MDCIAKLIKCLLAKFRVEAEAIAEKRKVQNVLGEHKT